MEVLNSWLSSGILFNNVRQLLIEFHFYDETKYELYHATLKAILERSRIFHFEENGYSPGRIGGSAIKNVIEMGFLQDNSCKD